MFTKRLHQGHHTRILGRDAVSNGRRDADDFLEHFDKGVVFVFAGFDLAGFHAEGAFEVHSLHPVLWLDQQIEEGKEEEYLYGMVEICCVKLATHSAVSTEVIV